MTKELSFRNLPFEPVNGQVIYVERTYNEKLNKFIRHNYEWLRTTFHSPRQAITNLSVAKQNLHKIINFGSDFLKNPTERHKFVLSKSFWVIQNTTIAIYNGSKQQRSRQPQGAG